MILTLFSFGLSWFVLALVFFWLTHLLPGFHSVYFQTVLGVGFLIGFFDAVIAKAALTMGFRPFNPIVYLIIAATDYILMQMTSNLSMGYYLTGHKGTVLAAIALAVVAFVVEAGKYSVLKDA